MSGEVVSNANSAVATALAEITLSEALHDLPNKSIFTRDEAIAFARQVARSCMQEGIDTGIILCEDKSEYPIADPDDTALEVQYEVIASINDYQRGYADCFKDLQKKG